MALPLSKKPIGKGSRSTSIIRVAVARDYDRKQLAAKHAARVERDYDLLERKMISGVKWNLRAENNNLRPTGTNNYNQDRSSVSLEDYIQQERIKQDNVINAKRLGNERIRRSSINSMPKV